MKSRKNHRLARVIALIGLLAMLGSVGISYAYWNKNVKVDASLSTGKMDVGFQDKCSILNQTDVISNEISYMSDSSIGSCSSNNVMVINAIMEKTAEINIAYNIENLGSISIKPMADRDLIVQKPDGSLITQKGLEVGVMCTPPGNLLSAQSKDKGTIRIRTKGNEEHPPMVGTYKFSLIIPYKQYYVPFQVDPIGMKITDGKWRRNLCIRGTVEVVE